MKLNYEGLQDKAACAAAGVTLPQYDWKEMCAETEKNPTWVHFGAGNIFRGFIAKLQHDLLNKGLVKGGIVAADTFDFDNINMIYHPYDSMTMLVLLMPDGTMKKEVVASISKGLCAGNAYPDDLAELARIFRNPSLQMVSFTITEKGYALKNIQDQFFPFVEADFANGPSNCSHAMSRVAALLLERYNACKAPLAVVSMDNCSHNGEKLRSSVMTVIEKWHANGFVSDDFVAWASDENTISFPWSMIDKITPRPAKVVEDALEQAGIEAMAPQVTPKNTFVAPFVNAEEPQYLVIEDRFPNGRPPLEKAGVFMTDRDTVNNTEKMKVTTCLNPLHTCLAVYGCMLGYDLIADEMKDPQLKGLICKVGYEEGLPVVVNPKILSPKAFIDEVIEKRLPNPFVPDTPQRIATDTSQKVAIRFGETIKSYIAREDLNPTDLTFVPLAIAGWLRYLLAIDDNGNAFSCSSDPMLETLQAQLSGVELGKPESAKGKLDAILTNDTLFGTDLVACGLSGKIESMFTDMLAGPGAVRATLVKYLG